MRNDKHGNAIQQTQGDFAYFSIIFSIVHSRYHKTIEHS